MPEYDHFLETIKLAASEAVTAGKPFALTYGIVKKTAPLTIAVDQKLELGPAQLLLTNAVREYKVEMTVDHLTEKENAHAHEYKGRKKFTVHLELKAGEKVLLFRMQGGQRYIVLDRVEVPQ